jgi:hypothetical protein
VRQAKQNADASETKSKPPSAAQATQKNIKRI